jgi:hypothetical protein
MHVKLISDMMLPGRRGRRQSQAAPARRGDRLRELGEQLPRLFV